MNNGYLPLATPSYPGPTLDYEGGPPQPQAFPQQGGYPQYSPYPPPPGGHQRVTHVVIPQSLYDAPGVAFCQHCCQNVITETEYVCGLFTCLSCFIFGIFRRSLCCFLPFCIDSYKDVKHRCPNCHHLIYVYERMN